MWGGGGGQYMKGPPGVDGVHQKLEFSCCPESAARHKTWKFMGSSLKLGCLSGVLFISRVPCDPSDPNLENYPYGLEVKGSGFKGGL